MKKIIYDGDMGGDDLWAVAVLASLVKDQKINLLGITTCFGNTNVQQGTRNVLDMMALTGLDDIPVYQGLDKPISGLDPLLDGAYGSNGLSNATLPPSNLKPQAMPATDWMADTLLNTDEAVTLICTGPISNIAKVYQGNPELDTKGHEIIWLGGSLYPAGQGHLPVTLPDGSYKRGNITHFAEFNAINDPVAAQVIADLKTTKVTFIPLDCTHHMAVTYERATKFMREMKGQEYFALQMLSMLDDAARLERENFDIFGPCLHDPQVIVYLEHPDVFLTPVPVKDVKFENNFAAAKNFDAVKSGFDFSSLGQHGQMTCEPSQSGNLFVVPGLTSFTDPKNVIHANIISILDLVERRWLMLTQKLKEGFKGD